MNIVVKEEQDQEKTTLTVEGEIDAYTAPELREKLLPLCQSGKDIYVDLSRVDYIDSTGLGVFIGAYKAQRMTEAKLVLTGMNERVKRLFRITGLNEIIDIQEDE